MNSYRSESLHNPTLVPLSRPTLTKSSLKSTYSNENLDESSFNDQQNTDKNRLESIVTTKKQLGSEAQLQQKQYLKNVYPDDTVDISSDRDESTFTKDSFSVEYSSTQKAQVLAPGSRDLNRPQQRSLRYTDILPGAMPHFSLAEAFEENESIKSNDSVEAFEEPSMFSNKILEEPITNNDKQKKNVSTPQNFPVTMESSPKSRPLSKFTHSPTLAHLASPLEQVPFSAVYGVDSSNDLFLYDRHSVASSSNKLRLSPQTTNQFAKTHPLNPFSTARNVSNSQFLISEGEYEDFSTFEVDETIEMERLNLHNGRVSPKILYRGFFEQQTPGSPRSIQPIKVAIKPFGIPLAEKGTPLDLSRVGKPKNLNASPFFKAESEDLTKDQRTSLAIIDYEINNLDTDSRKDCQGNSGVLVQLWYWFASWFGQDNFYNKYPWSRFLHPDEYMEKVGSKESKGEGNSSKNDTRSSVLGENNTDMIPYSIDHSPVVDFTTYDTISRKEYPYVIAETSIGY